MPVVPSEPGRTRSVLKSFAVIRSPKRGRAGGRRSHCHLACLKPRERPWL